MRKTVGFALVLGLFAATQACAPVANGSAAKSPANEASGANESNAVTTTTLSAKVDGPAAEEVHAQAEALPSAYEDKGKIKNAKLCVVPQTFAKKLCAGVYPEVALSMFGKSTPW